MTPRFVFLSPHEDDETLFASYLIQRLHPTEIITCFTSVKQEAVGVRSIDRMHEQAMAVRALLLLDSLPRLTNWGIPDTAVAIDDRASLPTWFGSSDVVVAPAQEDGGHEGHELVAEWVTDHVPESQQIRYLTYRRGHGRSTSDHEVIPNTEEVCRKLRAMACYPSQIGLAGTRPWFTEFGLREYVQDTYPFAGLS